MCSNIIIAKRIKIKEELLLKHFRWNGYPVKNNRFYQIKLHCDIDVNYITAYISASFVKYSETVFPEKILLHISAYKSQHTTD